MGEKEAATLACEGAFKDRLTKAAGAFMDDYLQADGKPDADALRKTSGERFQAGLRVWAAAHAAAKAAVQAAFPGGMAAGA